MGILTTEIPDTPESYKEFANNLKEFNLDIGEYMPDMGLPGPEDLKKLKEQAWVKLEEELGIDHPRLLAQYCLAHKMKGRIYANAVLHQRPKDAKDLVDFLSKRKETASKQDT